MMNTPCLNCGKRKLHCHSVCESYIGFQKEAEFIRQARGERNKQIGQVKDSVMRSKRLR